MKIYDKKKINKALDIAVYPRGGGKVNLKPLASVADSIEGNISSNAFAGTNSDADEVLPIEFYYIECTKEEDPHDEALRILNQKFGVNYYAQNKKGIVILLPLGELEPIQLHEGQEVKNIMFPGVYEGKGDFMDLDYPNYFMNETVGLHQIVITNPNFSEALCSVSNKRLIALLVTNKSGGVLEVPVDEIGVRYDRTYSYGIYVLYDLKVERVIEQEHLN